MDEDGAHTHGLRRAKDTQDGVGEEIAADPLALPTAIDGKPAKQHDGNRIGHIASDFPDRIRMQDRTGRQAVIADGAPARAAHECPRGALRFVATGAALEPVVKWSNARIERVQFVIRRKRRGRRDGSAMIRPAAHAFQAGLRASSFLRRRLVRGGFARASWNASQRFWSS